MPMEEPMAQVPAPVMAEKAGREDLRMPPTYHHGGDITEKKSLEKADHTLQSAEVREHYYDPLNPNDVYPTEEETMSLRRVPDKIPFASYLVAFVELGERFSYYGTTVVYTNFIQRPLPPGSRTGAGGHDGQPGALGMGQKAAFGLTTFNTFWIYLTPLLGAFLADQYFGRYKTVQIANIITLIGHIMLVVCAIPGVINKDGIIGLFAVAIVVMGVGTGMFKSNVSPLIAEQVTRQRAVVEERKGGAKVLVDPALTTARLFMYFYLFINIGSLVGQIGMVYAEKYVGFWLSYLLPTIVFLICPAILLLGKKYYVLRPPAGSVYPSAVRVIRAVNKGTFSLNPKKMFGPRNWDNAKPSKVVGERPAWMVFDDEWVDEVKRALSACKVFVFYPVYWLAYNQMTGNLTSQAAVMELNHVPNDIINNINPISLIIFIPIFDLFLYPFLRKHNIRFTPIRRITAGFFCATLAMIWATITQLYIYRLSPCGYSANTCATADGITIPAPINVWSQIGAYALIGFSEIFASITILEYAYTKAPRNMRSIVQALSLLTNAVSAAIGEGLVPLSDDPNLVWNYMTCTILAALGGIGFFFTFRNLDRQEETLNELPEGHVWPKGMPVEEETHEEVHRQH